MKNWLPWFPLVVSLNKGDLPSRTAEVFCEEIKIRTGLQLKLSPVYLTGESSVVFCTVETFASLGLYMDRFEKMIKPGKEGFSIIIVPESGVKRSVFVIGNDDRGMFFGMGKLLRILHLSDQSIQMDSAQTAFTDSPVYMLRGQQLAYRDKQNTCPCWTQKEFDRYIRDLALFGNNAIEILPPRTDDMLFSRVFQVDPFKMMIDLSRIIHSYGMDVWMWYPNMGIDYTTSSTREKELQEREKVFASIPYLDAVLIPAGDPGELEPELFFIIAEESAAALHKYHPNATVWIAPQVFAPSGSWYEDFYTELKKEPNWLYGVCFAPWMRDTINEFHEILPEKYKNRIRHYPDITHSLRSQFAVPDWDRAFQIFEGREVNNTRPKAMKHIHNLHAPYTIGSLTYSEGIHDDVNKFVWSQQDWNDKQEVDVTLREYVRFFIDPSLEDELIQAFFALEENWSVKKPIAENVVVDETYGKWVYLESVVSDQVKKNYRFLMGLLRATSDYYVKYKQIYDDSIEAQALGILKEAPHLGADTAMREASSILYQGINLPWDKALRDKQLKLADELRKLCGIKLTTHHHDGQHFRRGAYLDMIDFPLNNQQYLVTSFKKIRKLANENDKLEAIKCLINRTNPGEGGIYINLGSYESLPYIHFEKTWQEDPGMLKSAHIDMCGFAVNAAHLDTGTYKEVPLAKEWFMQAATYYSTPLIVRVPELDPRSTYQLKTTYLQPGRSNHIKLTLGNGHVVHEMIEQRDHFDPTYIYSLPKDSYKDGKLELKWEAQKEFGGAWINEIFIIKQEA
ncbi:MAG: hypothetical protein ACOX62_04205 [Christensenellales bacterium]|jgi:hypothetical protein